MSEIRELRLRYSLEGMIQLIELLGKTDLGVLHPDLAMFLVHASNAANWHDPEESA